MVILHKAPSLAKAPRYALLPSDDEDVDIKKLRKNADYLHSRVSKWEQIVFDNMTVEDYSPPKKPVVQKRKKKKSKHPSKKPVEKKIPSAQSSTRARAGPSGSSRRSDRHQLNTYKSDGDTYFYYNLFEMIFVVSLLAVKRYIGYAIEQMFRFLCATVEVIYILWIFVVRLKDPNWPFFLGMLILSGYIVMTGFIDQFSRLVYVINFKLGAGKKNVTVEDGQH